MKRKSILMWLIGAAAVIVVLFAASQFFPGIFGSEVETISVSGEATIYSEPEIANLNVQIITSGESAEEAQNENAQITDAVKSALISEGLPEKNIETTSYSVNPQYDWSREKQTLIGYQAYHSLKVKVEDIEDIGTYLDAAVDNGASVSYISFELTDKTEAEKKNEAIAEASASAKSKAESIADSMDVRIKGIYKITESNVNFYPYMAEARMDSAEQGGVTNYISITPSDVSVSAQITVLYRI